ncbi:ABC transporter permease subunit [Micromonospora mirobrigensis]|uniref:ABC-2 family transporter protein n=1 Tax=Micromonospora mirobrigensis TaxID=262898 RepID=A0A1C4ZSL4_9ACTN|nr:ABC transporter permease subunit [Micromonospora mirobrigensis]SCF35774.1 ABC-2 family transporter protein [Micromonospora mirobrigensis]
MSLYRTELRRLGKRRFTRYMALLGLLVLGAIVASAFVTNQKIGAEQVAAAERAAQAHYQQAVRDTDGFRAECEKAKAAGEAPGPRGFPDDCSQISPPPPEAFDPKWSLPSTFRFHDDFAPTLETFAALLAVVGFVVGASYVGAEWNTGGMMNLLLWRPKRLNVLLTKLAALLTGTAVVTVLAVALWTAAFWLVGHFRGTTTEMTAGVWRSFGLTELRAVVLVLAVTAVGFAVASLGRHTAFALGGAMAFFVVAQVGLAIVLQLAGVRFPDAWLLPTYGLAWMRKEVTLENYDACNASPTGGCLPDQLSITWQQSSVLLAVGLVLALGAALWTMRRRDVA